MKKVIVSLLVLLMTIPLTSALNIGLEIWTTNTTFYDNENVILNVNITNYELSLSPTNPKLIVKIAEKNYSISLDEIPAGKTVSKSIDLGKFDTGTYRVETYMEYNFLGVIDRTQSQYQLIRVLPSEPIRMKTYDIVISSIDVPQNIEINEEFEIIIYINSSTRDGFIEYGIVGEESERENLKKGEQIVSAKYRLESTGNYKFEVKAYVEEGNVVSLKDYRSVGFIVTNPEEYEEIEYEPIEIKSGNVTFELGKKPDRNLIEEIGCFVIGGCKGDLLGPEIRDVKILERGDKTIFTITADDTNTGNSSIVSCSIKIDDGDWQSMDAVDGEYDSTIENAIFIASTLYEQSEIKFKCEDELGNIMLSTFILEARGKGQLNLIVIDPLISRPVSGSKIYVDGELKGITDNEGIFNTELYEGRHLLLVVTKGYENKTQYVEIEKDKVLDIKIELSQTYEMRFEVPRGYEKFVYAKMAAKTQIHPQEKRLMRYSYPIYSTNKVDVIKDLITRIDDFIDYAMAPKECWDNYHEGCVAWHRTDYKIIETGKGVCYDWATLGISFADSYGIPARYVQGCWKYYTITGEQDTSCHAWQEVYLPELGGWKHLDTLWNEFDNPCVYANQMNVKCVFGFEAYMPGKEDYEPVSTYNCGRECNSIYSEQELYLRPFKETNIYNFNYFVNLDSKKADIKFQRSLDLAESQIIRDRYAQEQFNEETVKQILLDIVYPQFKDMGNISNVKFIIENLDDSSKPIIVGIDFEISFDNLDRYKHKFTISQYSHVNYTLKTKLRVFSISPAPDAKGAGTYNWFFESPGTYTIDLQVIPKKLGFVVSDSPIINSIAEVTSAKLNTKTYQVSDDDITTMISDNVSKVYLLGEYTDISSVIEEKIRKSGIDVERITDNEVVMSAKLALMFWNKTDIVIANLYDYDSIKSASEYAVKKKIPILVIKNNDEIPQEVRNSIEELDSEIIYISDPNNKFSQSVKIELEGLGKTTYLEIGGKRDKILREISSESITEKSQIPTILGIVIIIIILSLSTVIVVIFWKFNKN